MLGSVQLKFPHPIKRLPTNMTFVFEFAGCCKTIVGFADAAVVVGVVIDVIVVVAAVVGIAVADVVVADVVVVDSGILNDLVYGWI